MHSNPLEGKKQLPYILKLCFADCVKYDLKCGCCMHYCILCDMWLSAKGANDAACAVLAFNKLVDKKNKKKKCSHYRFASGFSSFNLSSSLMSVKFRIRVWFFKNLNNTNTHSSKIYVLDSIQAFLLHSFNKGLANQSQNVKCCRNPFSHIDNLWQPRTNTI